MVQEAGVPGPVAMAATAGKTHQLCVAFLDCPTVAKGAATYLVLAQNRIQQTFEFAAFDLDRMRAELQKDSSPVSPLTDQERAAIAESSARLVENPVDMVAYGDRVSTLVDLAQRYVEQESKRVSTAVGPGQQDIEADSKQSPDPDFSIPDYWIVFTEARFTNEYYTVDVGSDIIVVSLGYWRVSMAPPSALEFIVRMTQATCANFFLELPLHYFTKGCLLDFNEYLQDARLMVLVGDLCSTCRARSAAKPDELAALLLLLDKGWVGDMTTSTSVASVLKKVYDYDLYVSRGLSVNRLETFWDNVTSSSAQEFIRIIAAVVLAFLLLKFGLKAGG